jgi:predicted 3-demethylubiquinone-9 3-methyltransferase (glyoxalase superfamily)/uncharacterized protein YndB with AHSA1/START domain
MSDETVQSGEKEDIVITRILDAPVELVWRAWTQPEHVMRWWGPKYYTSPSCKIDFREGGKYIFTMRAPENQGGQDSYTSGVYLKIVPMERLEFTQGLSDENGDRIDPAQIGMPPDFPQEIRTVVTFKRIREDMTELTITEYGWTPGQMYVYSLAGMQQSIDKLAESLKKGSIIKKITPFLWFDDQAEEAMNFYISIFKNSRILRITRFGDEVPGPKGKVMTATFVLDGQELMALNGGPEFKFNEAVSFFVNCETQEEVDELWEKLSEGGEKGECGWLKDKYGLSWQIVPTILGEMLNDPDPFKAKRATEAMLKMSKLDIAGLKQAYEQE